MSPVPPPPGVFVPSDDWTDDPSFDLSPNASQLALPASPSPSSSSSHRSSISRSHTSSPLRQSFSSAGKSSGLNLRQHQKQEMDALDDDFDLPEGDLPPLSPRPTPKSQSRPRSSTASSSSSLITRTVVGSGPQGVGTVTKMGVTSPPTRSGVMAGTVKARARALEKAWEADVDLDELDQAVDKAESVGGTLRTKPSFHGRPLPPKDLPGEDALDGFGDLDDATFKPSKLQLPPRPSPSPSPSLSKTGTVKLDKAAGWERFGSGSSKGGSLRMKPSFEGRPLAPIQREQAGADALDDFADFDDDEATFKPPKSVLPTKKASSSKMKTISLESVSRGGTLKMQPSLEGRSLAPPKHKLPGADALDDFDDLDDDTFRPTKSQLPPKPSNPKMGSIPFDQGWENFGQVAGRRLLSPPRKTRPGAQALDDFPDLEDEDQATLKAGATIKALLPPPKGNKPSVSSIPDAPAEDPELEADFALPLNLTNLALASQPAAKPRRKGPRDSAASTVVSEWDSPGASSAASGRKQGWGWGSEDSPSGKRKSETSATSVSDDLEKEETKKEGDMLDEEEDLESGLVFEPAFFSSDRAKDLNSILDRKRRPQFAHQPQTPPGARRGGDDSFEDGLMLDEPGVELSRHRLRAQKRARDKLPAPSSTLRKGIQPQPQKTVVKEREKAWEKQREAAWGRNTPVQRERTQSSLGMSLRSHSVSTVARETPRGAEPAVTGREKEAMRSRSGHLHSMLPPPPPVPSSQPPTPSSSRLRHQKSHYQIGAPPQSPSLTRKQSLSSLQDAIAERNFGTHHIDALPPPPVPTNRYHNSTSRLTMPTSSSRAKIRPPVTSLFPASSPSSASTTMSDQRDRDREIRSRMYSTPIPRMVDVPKKSRNYGDGTELDGIDDLRVEEDAREAQRSMVGLGLGKPSRHHEPRTTSHGKEKSEKEERRKKSGGTTTTGLATKKVRRRGLIKHLGGTDKRKVVGEMIWNPNTLRWEGNEAVLRDFDTISSSRPALITHYTGSSVGVGGLSSPVASVAAAAPRIVKDMQFDPVQMKWVSVHPEDDEPDPFEGMADDEDEETGRGTIRAGAGRKYVPIGGSSSSMGSMGPGSTAATSSTWSHRMASESSMATSAASWEDRASHHVGVAISSELWSECKEAEERHRKEMKGWGLRVPSGSSELRERERREEKRLWEIRHLAMKS
ncbi:hypothetical protein L202_07607 [Cryptococcus amylolentus CBS 6039]|uniref:GTPase activator n=1 Tax=Cryptococcus amylolentus CBS 6039 TaxID=1295533 RepID=A0A1E3HDF4_9TREE|nr:hypothetical protein L202_07607 [Cryptococcus amylolentus CBS 6039]ODN74155.1 hypothetical protein L202_07607 [Cryptococcus amylolentus CBS 6039]